MESVPSVSSISSVIAAAASTAWRRAGLSCARCWAVTRSASSASRSNTAVGREPRELRSMPSVRTCPTALDELDDVGGGRRLRCVPEPRQPGELALRPGAEQAVEAHERVCPEGGCQHRVREPLGAGSGAADHRLEHEGRRQQHAPAAQLLDKNAGELAGPHDRLRGRRQEADHLARQGAGEGSVSAGAHQLGEVCAAGRVARRVVTEGRGRNAELTGDVGEHGTGRRLPCLEHAAGAAHVKEQQGEAEPVGVGALRRDQVEIVARQRVVAGDLALVGRRLEVPCPQIVAQQPPPRHRRSPRSPERAYPSQ